MKKINRVSVREQASVSLEFILFFSQLYQFTSQTSCLAQKSVPKPQSIEKTMTISV